MRSLTPYERIKAMVAGREVDRPGASVWKHFHQDDRDILLEKTHQFNLIHITDSASHSLYQTLLRRQAA